MRTVTKLIAMVLIVGLGVVLVFIPFIPGPAAPCNGYFVCIPDQRQSITNHFLGFGGWSSYGGEFYRVQPGYLVTALISVGSPAVGGLCLLILVKGTSYSDDEVNSP